VNVGDGTNVNVPAFAEGQTNGETPAQPDVSLTHRSAISAEYQINGFEDMFGDAYEEEAVDHSAIEVVEAEEGAEMEVRKRPRTYNISKFHYRRSYYDIAFAVSITDEILALEPLEDKLCILKRKYEYTPFQLLDIMRGRVAIFSIYNLFDTVEYNHLDNQVQL
jgi:hypothetical protein